MDPFVGEIRIFAGNFAPSGWALCNGQLMPIQQNTALFSLLGVTYGGNGTTTYALPDLMGAAPLQQGQGLGLRNRFLGEVGGQETVSLLTSEMPAHTHVPSAVDAAGDSGTPNGDVWARASLSKSSVNQYSSDPPTQMMSAMAVGVTGGNQPHNNMPPYLCVTFIIALQGIYPSRS